MADRIEASTLIFVGEDDRQLVPQLQGRSLYKYLSSRSVDTELYEFPDYGHFLSGTKA